LEENAAPVCTNERASNFRDWHAQNMYQTGLYNVKLMLESYIIGSVVNDLRYICVFIDIIYG